MTPHQGSGAGQAIEVSVLLFHGEKPGHTVSVGRLHPGQPDLRQREVQNH